VLLCFNENSWHDFHSDFKKLDFSSELFSVGMKQLVLLFSSSVWCITKKKSYRIVLGKENCCKTSWWFPFHYLLGIESSCLIWCCCKILKMYVF